MLIDLSVPIKSDMQTFNSAFLPSVDAWQTLEKDGWNTAKIQLSSQDGTHVSLPFHAGNEGKNLDYYKIGRFIGPATTYGLNIDIVPSKGVIFCNTNITLPMAQLITKVQPLFVGLAFEYSIDVSVKRLLLENNVILFEQLANTAKLPKNFTFYGVPLNISGADGSPVRAFAITD